MVFSSITSARWKRSRMSTDSSITMPLEPTTRHHCPPSSMRSETASPMVSSGVSSANSWLIWNVRAMPSCTRLCASRLVMSCPSSAIVPAVGRSTPVRRLMIVVLPAPFGPISAWRAPFSTDSETSFVAVMPPNCLINPWVSSTGGMVAPLACEPCFQSCLQGHGALGDGRGPFHDMRPRNAERRDHHDGEDDALHERQLQHRADREDQRRHHGAVDPPEQDHHHQHQAEPELPVLRRDIGEIVLHELEQHRADQSAVKIAGAADDQNR